MRFLDAKVRPGLFLVRSRREAEIVRTLAGRLPGIRGLAILLDHVHVAVDDGPTADRDLRHWLNRVHATLHRHRGERGPLWDPHRVSISHSSGAIHELRKLRYCSLNPCRGGHAYVSDPLEWPWTTHRDLLALSPDPVVAPHPRPAWFHESTVRPADSAREGSAFPRDPGPGRIPGLRFDELLARVASLHRCGPDEVLARGRRRQFLLGAARVLLEATPADIARAAGVHRATVLRAPEPTPERLAIVRRVARDDRFFPWTEERFRRLLRRFGPARPGRG